MADHHYSVPHRKPVGMPAALRQPAAPSHTHSRTVSSNIFPAPSTHSPSMSQQQAYAQYPPYPGYHPARRTPSTATASTTSSGPSPARVPSSVSMSLRRTPSNRSGQSVTPTSYVALMRKQKATVWCDRSQHLDPRISAQQKAAKHRATLEVVGTAKGGSATSTNSAGGVRGKIRHHGAQKTVGYSPATLLVGAGGMPARLSASEVGDEENSDEAESLHRGQGRVGSGRSSLGSGKLAAYRPYGRMSQGGTPPSGNDMSPVGREEETPVPGRMNSGGDYFQHPKNKGNGGSGSSGEREEGFGGLSELGAPKAAVSEGKKGEDLSRRGSVDERAMTMRGPRLFVANPDNSDSD
jgi:hypothetical protein